MIREIFLQQNAFHPIDTYCPLDKQYKLMNVIMKYRDLGEVAMGRGAPIATIGSVKAKAELSRARFEEGFDQLYEMILKQMDEEFGRMEAA
ncbi:MAG: hypothetical protein HY556_05645 [Euryarchaeota archaeon]|nr:hypothetical protein [Euryarchaeota archaeon]